MNYLTEERKNALASEYVLGTLHGSARVRFQRLLMEHKTLRQTLWFWESQLNTLGGALPEQMPRLHVWKNIQARLNFAIEAPAGIERASDGRLTSSSSGDKPGDKLEDKNQSPASGNVTPLPHKAQPRTWQWVAVASSMAAMLLAALLIWPNIITEPAGESQFAMVQSDKAQALWLIEVGGKAIKIQATDKLTQREQQDYELWLVAADGRAPVSLGLLPQQGERVLPRPALVDQVTIAALAVSLEPLGGSPTGQPTTVLYTAELVTL